MMCDTSLMHTANRSPAAAQRVADGRSDRPDALLTCGNEETAKVIGKP